MPVRFEIDYDGRTEDADALQNIAQNMNECSTHVDVFAMSMTTAASMWMPMCSMQLPAHAVIAHKNGTIDFAKVCDANGFAWR